MSGADVVAMARLDLAEVVRSRWLLTCMGVYLVLSSAFVLVGMRESTVIGFTGMGRVLFSLCHALVLILPLLALMVTGQVINRAREQGALELFLTHPVRRTSYFAAVSAVRYLALALPLVALFVALGAIAKLVWSQPIPWGFVARASAISSALLWAFAALGLATSVVVRNPARAMTLLLLFWLVGVSLLDFGLIGTMLTWRLNPQTVFLLAALNPVQSARLALLSAAEPDLATLGPVGFFMSQRLGADGLLLLGLAWPTAFGVAAWTFALRAFRRGDLV